MITSNIPWFSYDDKYKVLSLLDKTHSDDLEDISVVGYIICGGVISPLEKM